MEFRKFIRIDDITYSLSLLIKLKIINVTIGYGVVISKYYLYSSKLYDLFMFMKKKEKNINKNMHKCLFYTNHN